MLELTLLGPARVCLNGEPVTDFFASKALLLFCYLALEEDRVYARETLVTLLWGERPENLARSNVRQSLYNLQRLFPGYLTVTRTTVAFDRTQPYRLDVDVFRQLLEQPAVTPVQLEAALAMYTGEFLEGMFVEDAPELEAWVYTERERYRLLLLNACEQLVSHYIRQGEWALGKQLAQRVLTLEPWRETSHRQMMLLLARQGEYNAALAQYESCCAVLDEELGIEPAPETVLVYERIQQARTTKRHNLPQALRGLVGRQAELQRLDDWLRDPERRLITLVGPGGVGKTRLGQELASRHAQEFLNGARCVSLGAITQPEHVVTAIADVVGASFSGPAAPAEQLVAHLSDQELLLVLDGFEHVLAAAGFVADILQATTDVKIVVTSREKLDLHAEWVFAVDGLLTPPEELPAGHPLEQYASIEYFVQCARRQDDGFALNGQGVAAAALCRALGGSPLGIELAASLLPAATCAQIMAEMAQSLDVLASTRRDVPERHRSLRAVFEHSWRLLAGHERDVFSRLSVFPGSFTLDAARQMAGADLVDLNGLIAKSLLRPIAVEEGDVARYDIHEILRQYAEEMLAGDGVIQQQVQAAHMAYYADFMRQQADLFKTNERSTALDAIWMELDNVYLAWRRAIESRNGKVIQQIAPPLHELYEARAWLRDGCSLFAGALRAWRPARTPDEQQVEGQLLAYCAAFHVYQADEKHLADALTLVQEAVTILRRGEPGEPLALALNALGAVHVNQSNYPAAIQSFQECIAVRRMQGTSILVPLVNLSTVCVFAGDYVMAKQASEDALVLSRQEGNRLVAINIAFNLCLIYSETRDWVMAKHYCKEALSLNDEVGGGLRLKGLYLLHLSMLNIYLEAYEEALISAQDGLALMRESNTLINQAEGLFCRGLAQCGLEDCLAASQSICEGLEIVSRLEEAANILHLLSAAAILFLKDGREPDGIQLLKFIACHPATEQDDRLRAQELLAKQGIVLAETETAPGESSLMDVTNRVLYKLQAVTPHIPPVF